MYMVFEFDGVQYRLRFTINAICELERMGGCSISRVMDNGLLGISLLLWAGLLHENVVTLEQAGEIVEKSVEKKGSLESLNDVIKTALEVAGFSAVGEGLRERIGGEQSQSVSQKFVDMLDVAVLAGISPNAFWGMTPHEISAYIKAFKDTRNILKQDFLQFAWQMGKFVGIAVNNPSQYPSLIEKPPEKSVDNLEQKCRLMASAFGDIVKNRGEAK